MENTRKQRPKLSGVSALKVHFPRWYLKVFFVQFTNSKSDRSRERSSDAQILIGVCVKLFKNFWNLNRGWRLINSIWQIQDRAWIHIQIEVWNLVQPTLTQIFSKLLLPQNFAYLERRRRRFSDAFQEKFCASLTLFYTTFVQTRP